MLQEAGKLVQENPWKSILAGLAATGLVYGVYDKQQSFDHKARAISPLLVKVASKIYQSPAPPVLPEQLSIDCADPQAPKVSVSTTTPAVSHVIYQSSGYFRAERVEGAQTQYCTLLLPDRLYTVHPESECNAIVDAVRGPLAKYLKTRNGETGA